MDRITKGKITNYLLLLVFAVFPFGQLPGIFVQNLLGLGFRIHTLDLLIIFTTTFTLIVYRHLIAFRLIRPLVVVTVFGLAFSVFTPYFDLVAVFYLLRLSVYLIFIWFFTVYSAPLHKKILLLKSLVVIGIVIAALGLVQYLLFPDLVSLKYFGWDDHYYRLVSTFLDPAFTGILLTLAVLTTVSLYVVVKKRIYLITLFILLPALGLTYSRASFIALTIGLFYLLWSKYKKLFLALALVAVGIVMLLPRSPGGEGVKLERTASIVQKFGNYKDGLKIVSASPVFGVGYNNICLAKEVLGLDTLKQENSCYGLDNSFLLLLASTGILGFLIFLKFFINVYQKAAGNAYGYLFRASAIAVSFHALFSNSLFYPWVIIWLATLAAVSRRSQRVSKFKF